MKVILAGFNLDADTVNEMKVKSNWNKDNVTPETLSASYARISRDERDINLLREEAREEVEKARKSNNKIIFGLGHASVAEHAYFNFDIIGISRLATEFVQKFRLASFTEKSQRYITLDGDYVLPEEIEKSGLKDEFNEIIDIQNKAYFELYGKLKEYLFSEHKEMVKKKIGASTVDGWAKEDARYVVSLATKSQFGMSVNARTLENMLRQFYISPLSEVRELAKELHKTAKELAPSIIKYVEPSENLIKKEKEINKLVDKYKVDFSNNSEIDDVKLVNYTQNPDDMVAASFFTQSYNIDLKSALEKVSKLTVDEKTVIIKTLLSYNEFYDRVQRYFEYSDFTFDLIVSATNYAQLKRHRISSQIACDYNPAFGVTIPENIKIIGETELFNKTIEKTEKFYNKINNINPNIAPYILTNAHRRRILFKANLRELYHFASLRIDNHAQWDIRNTATEIRNQLFKVAPITSLMLCGKSEFDDFKNKVFLRK